LAPGERNRENAAAPLSGTPARVGVRCWDYEIRRAWLVSILA